MTQQERGPSTMSNLDELERLLEAATPGPWGVGEGDDPPYPIITTPNGHGMVAETWGGQDVEHGHADAALIVAAVNSLPALIAAARRAEALEKAGKFPRNVIIQDECGFIGRWVAVPEDDFDVLRSTLTEEGAPR